MKKKLNVFLSLAAMSVSNQAMAWEEICISDVYTGAPCYTLDAGFRAICYQPSANNLHYAAVAFPTPAPSPHWQIADIKPDYNFGFELDLTAVFCERATKLAVSWEHYDQNDSDTVQVPSVDMIGPLFAIGPDTLLYQRAHGKVQWLFDQINLDYGTYVNFGDCFQTNFFVGLSGARIKETVNTFFSGTFTGGGFAGRNIHTPSTFTGGGPRIGVDLSYSIFDGFRLAGQAAAALMVGTLVNHTEFKTLFPSAIVVDGISSPNYQDISVKNRSAVVPEFEGRLGFAYDFTICRDFFVQLEAGYEAKVFINAIQSADIGSQVITPPVTPDEIGLFARTFKRTLSNFALAGPYVSINVGF